MIGNSENIKNDNLIDQHQQQHHHHQKPTVMITTYSECHSRFRFARNKQKQQQQQFLSKNNLENNNNNKFQSMDRSSLYENGEDEEESATKSERSTDFFNQLKRSQTRQNNKILMDLSQIKGPTGSIRGHKDVVRKSLEEIKVASTRRLMFNLNSNFNSLSTFMSSNGSGANSSGNYYLPFSLTNSCTDSASLQQSSMFNESIRCEYLERLVEDEQNCCVAYTTTLGVIRRTYEDSKLMKSILNLNLIKFEERDIYLNQEYKFQLKIRCNSIVVPALFVDGQYIGGVKEVELRNENGDLQKDLSKFKLSSASKGVCLCCGNAKFIACPSCNGSRKSAIHHFKYNSIALRCIKCDKNDGLVQCPRCHSSSQSSSSFSGDDEELHLSGDEKIKSTSEADQHETLPRKTAEEAPVRLVVDENNNRDEVGEKQSRDQIRI